MVTGTALNTILRGPQERAPQDDAAVQAVLVPLARLSCAVLAASVTSLPRYSVDDLARAAKVSPPARTMSAWILAASLNELAEARLWMPANRLAASWNSACWMLRLILAASVPEPLTAFSIADVTFSEPA